MKNKKKNDVVPALTRAVGYIRVSTEKQADHGNSLEAQRAKLEAYARTYDLDIVAWEVDAGESAGTLERPGLQRALARLDAFEASALVIAKLDRLTRDVRDLCTLVDTYFKDGQHSLMSVGEQIDTSNASGRLVINILTVVSQWERETIGERTSSVMQHMRASGQFTGGWPPYGFSVDDEGCLHECPAEREIIHQARALKASGMSLRMIAVSLPPNPRTSRAFDHKQIARMLACGEAV